MFVFSDRKMYEIYCKKLGTHLLFPLLQYKTNAPLNIYLFINQMQIYMPCYAIEQEVIIWVTFESLVLLNFELMFFSLVIQISPAYFFKSPFKKLQVMKLKTQYQWTFKISPIWQPSKRCFLDLENVSSLLAEVGDLFVTILPNKTDPPLNIHLFISPIQIYLQAVLPDQAPSNELGDIRMIKCY